MYILVFSGASPTEMIYSEVAVSHSVGVLKARAERDANTYFKSVTAHFDKLSWSYDVDEDSYCAVHEDVYCLQNKFIIRPITFLRKSSFPYV